MGPSHAGAFAWQDQHGSISTYSRSSSPVHDQLPPLTTAPLSTAPLTPPYTGKTKSDVLQRHINTYAAGKKCASQVVLDASTDLTKMKVAQLKALITAKSIDCSGCVEKGDYVAALKGWLEQHGAGQKSKEEL